MYDFLIVGTGLFGSVFAHKATANGKKCLLIDKRNHTGGNIHMDSIDGINIHTYGPHIFHTNDEKIWQFVTGLVPFNDFMNSPLATINGRLYNLPFNMNTFHQIWPDVITPAQAQARISEQASIIKGEPANLEEQAISMVGTDIYKLLIQGYTEKQWGRPCRELPAFIIKRLPLRFTFDNNYFNDRYQGIPIGGYNRLTDALLSGCEVRLSTDFFSDWHYFSKIAKQIVYTGPIDQLLGYKFGKLTYRSLRFETQHLAMENYQGNAVINHTDGRVPFTRIIEHKHFEKAKSASTVITHEYPASTGEPYYPVNDEENQAKFKKYKEAAADRLPNFILGGRLAEYRYYDMHQVIASALKAVNNNIYPGNG